MNVHGHSDQAKNHRSQRQGQNHLQQRVGRRPRRGGVKRATLPRTRHGGRRPSRSPSPGQRLRCHSGVDLSVNRSFPYLFTSPGVHAWGRDAITRFFLFPLSPLQGAAIGVLARLSQKPTPWRPLKRPSAFWSAAIHRRFPQRRERLSDRTRCPQKSGDKSPHSKEMKGGRSVKGTEEKGKKRRWLHFPRRKRLG
jgi:hypothetical protein